MNISDHPLVSVIIPTYNRSDLLVQAIASVNRQSYQPIEIIIVDDGSTDGTDSVVNDIKKSILNIRYFWKTNGGCASARNMGLTLAQGEIISFLDSDDEFEPEAIKLLVLKMLESKAEFVYSPAIEVYPNHKQVINFPVAADNPESLAESHFMSTNIRNGSYIFTRSKLEQVGILDESLKYNEDSDFVQRLVINSKAGYLANPTIRVFNHATSKSRNRIEIYKALLRSSEKIILENPEFSVKLGANAELRIHQIKTKLIEAQIMENNFQEAQFIKQGMGNNLRLTVKLSLFFKTKGFLILEDYLQKARNKIMKSIFSSKT